MSGALPIEAPLLAPLGRNGWIARVTQISDISRVRYGQKRLETRSGHIAKVDVEGSNPFSRSAQSETKRDRLEQSARPVFSSRGPPPGGLSSLGGGCARKGALIASPA